MTQFMLENPSGMDWDDMKDILKTLHRRVSGDNRNPPEKQEDRRKSIKKSFFKAIRKSIVKYLQ